MHLRLQRHCLIAVIVGLAVVCIVGQKDRLIVVSCGMTLPSATTAAATWLPVTQIETVHQAGVTRRHHMVSINSLLYLAPALE